MRTRFGTILLTFAALLALTLLAGCGGDDSSGPSGSSDTDPQEILDAALGDDQQIDSGVLDLSFDLESTGGTAGTISASVEGPFQSREVGQLPLIDLTANASVDSAETSFEFDGGLTVTEDGAYVSFDGTDYEVDDQTFALLEQSYEQSAQLQEQSGEEGSLQAFGIDPANWLSELTNEGTEDLDGTEVVHVSGTADVPRIVEDLTSIAEQTGQSSQIDQAQFQNLEDLVSNATVDVYASAEDSTLRQLDLGIDVNDPSGEETTTVGLSIGIDDPNGDVEITAPDDAQPIADLLGQIPGGAEALGGLGSLGGTGASSGSGGTPPGGAAAGDYYDCAAGAESEADLEACAELLAP